MNNEEYAKLLRLSSSSMTSLSRSPAHYQAWRQMDSKPTPALEFGIACHTAILEPSKFNEQYVAFSGSGVIEKRLLKKAHPGKKLISIDDLVTINSIKDAVLAHPFVSDALKEAKVELENLWTINDCPCKGRMDIFTGDAVIDIKTTGNALEFEYSIERYNYHRQAAFYLDGCGAKEFYWVVVEKEVPYGVIVYKATEKQLQAGRDKYLPLCDVFTTCLKTNYWPGYSQAIHSLLPTTDCPF